MMLKMSSSVKRKCSDGLPNCKYGKACYRKNPVHFLEYNHHKDTSSVNKRPRLDNQSFFLTTVEGIDEHFNRQAIGLKDILADEELLHSVQFNYMFDLDWLVQMYPSKARGKPLLIVHGHTGGEKNNLEAVASNYTHIDLMQARLPIPYGTHHSKMMLLFYTNRMRVVVTTANLIHQDWHQKTQGVWMSPFFLHSSSTYNESEDLFKCDLLEYLQAYSRERFDRYIATIKEFDMKSANVRLVGSVPGRHSGPSLHLWGHMKLRKLLKTIGPSKDHVSKFWPVIGQFSSIGSLGADASKWLCSEWLESLSACKGGCAVEKAELKLIYPTIENVRNSLEGYSAGGSLPFSVQLAMKQRYLRTYLNGWNADNVGRSHASPHIKSYTRVSPDNTMAAWFLLTSANLSKAAWGVFEKIQSQLMIRSYEVGVLFTPSQNEVISCFNITNETNELSGEMFSLPFHLPLTPYSTDDKPWVWDIRYTKEDSHGRLWVPS